MNRLVVCRALARQFSTTARTSTKLEVHPKYLVLREKMKHFQINDGTPVHFKGGPMDRALYGATIVVNMIGFCIMAEFFYGMAYK